MKPSTKIKIKTLLRPLVEQIVVESEEFSFEEKIQNIKTNIKRMAPSVNITNHANEINVTYIITADSLSPLNKIKRYFDKASSQGVKCILSGKKVILQVPNSIFDRKIQK